MKDCWPIEVCMEGENYDSKLKRLHITAESAISLKKKSHLITMQLIEDEVTIEYLKDKIRYITPEQYEDVPPERALREVCGYPLCQLKLTSQYASQKFIIRHNKVFDVTQRKNFCSDTCYEASNIIANQVPKVPLYLRKTDKQIANFELYVPDRSSLRGRFGRPVNIKGFIEDEDEVVASKKFEINESSSGFSLKKKDEEGSCIAYEAKKPFCAQPSIAKKNDSESISQRNKEISNLEEEKNSKTDSVLKHCEALNKTKHLDLLLEVEQQMRQWMTFESLRLILGDIYVRGMLEELGKTWEDYDSTAGLCLGLESKSRYIALCKKLDIMEIEEEICDKSIVSPNQSTIASKPVPSFDQLKKDVDEQAIKVKAFFEGKEEFAIGAMENNLETINEDEKNPESLVKDNKLKTKPNRRKPKEKLNDDSDVEFVTLPLIDSYTQTSWRRIIVLEKISKSIASFSCEFGLDEGQIRNLLKPLIASFDFTARNIIFRVTQWDFVALILIKMLSVRYPVINEAMRSAKGCKVIASLLAKTAMDNGYLDRLLTYLTEIVYILSKYHKNNDCSVNNKVPDGTAVCHDGTGTENSSSNENFDQKDPECCVDKESDTINPSQFTNSETKIKDVDNDSSKVCENPLNKKDVAESLSTSKLESNKDIDTNIPITESSIENVVYDDNYSVNVTSNIKDFTDVREIISKVADHNIREKLSTNMEELD